MNRIYQNTFVNSILKFTQNLYFKVTKDLKSVSQNSSFRWIWVVLFLFSLEQSFSQASHSPTLPCIPNTLIADAKTKADAKAAKDKPAAKTDAKADTKVDAKTAAKPDAKSDAAKPAARR